MVSINKVESLRSRINDVKFSALGKEKVLVISDLHIPFHREQMIIDIILKHRHEINAIIFGGDIVDCEGISKFPKEIRKPLIEEMIVAYKLLNRIDKLTPGIKKIFIWGNHEYRFVKYLADYKNELNPFHSDNVLQNIVSGFTHHDRLNRKKTTYPPLSSNFEVINKWFVQYNDLIVAHPKNFSKVPLKTATLTVEHFLKRGFKFKALYIGHTHKWGNAVHYSVLTGELGCNCQAMEYSDTGNTGYSPQDYGYAVVSFNDGVLDIENNRLHRIQALEEGDAEWLEETVDLS